MLMWITAQIKYYFSASSMTLVLPRHITFKKKKKKKKGKKKQYYSVTQALEDLNLK